MKIFAGLISGLIVGYLLGAGIIDVQINVDRDSLNEVAKTVGNQTKDVWTEFPFDYEKPIIGDQPVVEQIQSEIPR